MLAQHATFTTLALPPRHAIRFFETARRCSHLSSLRFSTGPPHCLQHKFPPQTVECGLGLVSLSHLLISNAFSFEAGQEVAVDVFVTTSGSGYGFFQDGMALAWEQRREGAITFCDDIRSIMSMERRWRCESSRADVDGLHMARATGFLRRWQRVAGVFSTAACC